MKEASVLGAVRAEDRPRLGLQPSDRSALAVVVARIERVSPAVSDTQLAKGRDTLPAERFRRAWLEDCERSTLAVRMQHPPGKIVSGEIFALAKDNGIPAAADLKPPSIAVGHEEARDLVVDVILVLYRPSRRS
jgi:hypothetical protein